MDLFRLAGSIVLDASGVNTDLDSIKEKVKEVEAGFQYSQEQMEKISGSMQRIGGIMSAAFTVPLGIIGKKSMEAGNAYEGQMNRVEAISGAVGDELQMLDDRARELGKSSVFSATESAGAMEMMASAGFKALEIYDSLPGVIDLAAVSGGDMALSSQAVAAAVNQFKLEAEDATHVADIFAKASAETNAQTHDMAEAMKNAGPMASSLGVSLEETAAMIGLMANQNIKGGLAGTTMKNAMLQLTGASEEAKAMMNEMGVEVFDSSGDMNSMAEIISQLRSGMERMTEEQKQNTVATIFGRQAIGGMMALVNTAPGELEAMTQGLVDSDGAASDMAETMNKGVPGALASMRSSFEVAFIAIQEAMAPFIIAGAKVLTFLADTFTAMPGWLQTVIVVAGGILAAVGPILVLAGSLMKNMLLIEIAIAALSGPVLLVIGKAALIVGAIIGVITVITKLIEWIKDLGITWSDIGDLMIATGELILDIMTAPIRTAYSAFKWLIESILGLFGFEFEFPSLMEAAEKAWEGVKDFFKWSIDGIAGLFGFDGFFGDNNNKPKPKGNTGGRGGGSRVGWNAKGGVFSKPTIFDTANAGLQGVGEAGVEAIIPLSPDVLAGIGKGIDAQRDNSQMIAIVTDMASEFKAMRKDMANMKVEMDGRAVGGIVTPYVDDNLGKKRHFNSNRF